MTTTEGFTWSSEKVVEGTFDQVVQLWNQGLPQMEIARKLQKNKGTISRHINQARQKGLLSDQDSLALT